MQKIGPFRRFDTGESVFVWLHGPQIGAIDPYEPQSDHEDLPWISPGFWDIQTNGRWGISFAAADLTEEGVRRVVLENVRSGITKVFPTLITASPETLLHGVRTIASACERWKLVDKLVGGIHLEGPWISDIDGYRGAHAPEAVRDPDFPEFRRIQEASGRRVAIVTLAPERAGAIEFIRRLSDAGVTVAIGHTAADGPKIREAITAGARLSTHLGNGIASPLPRHPNPIWHQAADDRLMASFIADGEHLSADVLRVLARAKGSDRTILVSDLGPLAGSPPGRYGDWEVADSGKIVVAGTDYLAGSAVELPFALSLLRNTVGWGLEATIDTVTRNPARLLGRKIPGISIREAADLVVFRLDAIGEIRPIEVFVEGCKM